MLQHELTAQHIDIAETFIRLYVFLTQYIDSCESETVNQDYPEVELQKNLASARAEMLDILKVNPVVKGKVEKECERVFSLVTKALMGGTEKSPRWTYWGRSGLSFRPRRGP